MGHLYLIAGYPLKKQNGILKIIGSLLVFVLLFIANLFVPAFKNITHTARMWLVLDLGVVLLSVILLISGQVLHFQFNIYCLLTALSPVILEEICYRLLLFAYCLSLLKGEIRNKSENFWCYFMMIIPHVLIHTPDTFLTYGILSGVVSVLMISLIFGLPFAILQRKRDLTSAMIAHGTVDVIRFSFLGLPF